ncbi:PIG-L deacetylase family protein [Streptomyces spiramenti]|uniref:PIG-L family deacetylase n=1 Tax=Streptomyces spiramenti TaxID=2720606 RepID=A0ABX1ASD3_9ACTN|nr:PIG-L family deacetylase [Streptomyces spiramenti]NJP67337.1 PIG-L family deacetylase [Streptomyces spiramenti]
MTDSRQSPAAAHGAPPPLLPLPLEWDRALAIAAHPDDLEYGAAAAVAEWTAAGKDVRYLLVTRGEAGIDSLAPERCGPLREREQRAGAERVGVGTVEFLDHRDGVVEGGVALRRDLAAAIRRHRPQLVVTLNHREHFGDRAALNTPDHRAVGRAAIDAAGDAGNRWIFREQLDRAAFRADPGNASGAGEDGRLSPWNGVRWVAVAASPQATHAQPVGEDALRRAVASLREHRAYLEGLGVDPDPYSADLVRGAADASAGSFDGHRCVPFELFPR